MISRRLLWGIAYSVLSLSSFGILLTVSASNAHDFLMLMHELTDNYRCTVLLNFIVFCFLSIGVITIHFGFGHMRIVEYEHIADSLPFYSVSLLYILFSDDNLLLNVIWMGFAVLMKIYHVVTYDRVDMIQVQIVNRISQHQHTKLRVFSSFLFSGYVFLLAVFLVLDLLMARFLAYDVFQGVGSIASLLFGIQFGVMGIDCLTYMGKLVLSIYELMFYRCANSNEDDVDDEDDLDEQIWEHRTFYMQGFDMITSVLKATFYSVFIYTLYFHSKIGFPIPLVQGCISSVHQVVKQTMQFVTLFSQARQLEKQLVTPSEEELSVADHTCIICREDMHNPTLFFGTRGRPLNRRKYPKKLSCGHILHLCCLKDWLERSKSCPLCRKVVFSKTQTPQSQDAPVNVPPTPAPLDRPVAPVEMTDNSTAINIHAPSEVTSLSTPTSTGQQEVGVERTGVSRGTETSRLAFLSTCTISTFANDTVSVPRLTSMFVPRDWASLSLTPTSDPCSFRVNLSTTQNVQLTVHRSTTLD